MKDRPGPPQGARVRLEALRAFYGDAEQVKGIDLEFEANQVTAIIGPSGCGKSTMVRCINRMHEEIPGARAEGRVLLDDLDVYDPSVDVVAVRRAIGMVFQKPNPFPTMSIFDNVAAGPRLSGSRRGDLHAKVETALRGAGLWEEVKDRLERARRRPLRRPAAAAVHRALARRRARGDPDGRALLGARPDRHAEDRGADRRAQDARDDRDRHPQHAAGGARGRPHRLHAQRRAGRGRRDAGDLHQPDDSRTEEYVTGKFG